MTTDTNSETPMRDLAKKWGRSTLFLFVLFGTFGLLGLATVELLKFFAGFGPYFLFGTLAIVLTIIACPSEVYKRIGRSRFGQALDRGMNFIAKEFFAIF